MARQYSDRLLLELQNAVNFALQRDGMVNVPAIAFQISARHPHEAGCPAEFEACVMAMALRVNAIIFFHRADQAAEPACV